MSQPAPSRDIDSPPSSSEARTFRSWRVALGAIIWLLLFITWALSAALPNNKWSDGEPMTRWQLWEREVPRLIDVVDPPPADPREPAESRLLREHSGWRYFPQRFDLLAVAAVILVGSWGLGSLLLRQISPPSIEPGLERFALACGLGLSGLSLATLGCGLAGWLSRGLLGTVVVLPAFAECVLRLAGRGSPPLPLPPGEGRGEGRPQASSTPSSSGAPSNAPGEGNSARNIARQAGPHPNPLPGGEGTRRARVSALVLCAITIPFLLAMLLGALLPSTDFDVNEYHFQGPKEYLQNGRISFLPHNVYTSFPFFTEMLTLLSMVLRDDWYRGAIAGKTLLMAFGPLTALLLFVAGRRWFGTTAGIFAAMLYLTTPWTYRISTIAYVEGALSFYLLLAFYLVAVGIAERRAGRDHANRTFLLAGLAAGSAMACKYPGVVSVVIPLFVVVSVAAWRRSAAQTSEVKRQPSHRWWQVPAVFALGVALTIGPWFLKNLVETGNPVYPLLYTVFDGSDWSPELNVKWRNGHSPHSFHLYSREDRFNLVDATLDMAARNDWVNPLLVALAVPACFVVRPRGVVKGLSLYSLWLLASWWLLTHRIDRFWVPSIPILALLSGAGGAWFWNEMRLAGRIALVTSLTIVTAANLVIVISPLGGYNAYLLDMKYAREFVAHVTAPEIVHLNEQLPPGSKVLAVGDAEMFEARFPVVYNTVFDNSIFEAWFGSDGDGVSSAEKRLTSASEIRQKLAAEGITHLYVNWLEILRYRSPGNYGYTDFVTPARFIELERMGILAAPWTIPDAVSAVSGRDPGWISELRRFGPELIHHQSGTEVFTTFQVFPVLAE